MPRPARRLVADSGLDQGLLRRRRRRKRRCARCGQRFQPWRRAARLERFLTAARSTSGPSDLAGDPGFDGRVEHARTAARRRDGTGQDGLRARCAQRTQRSQHGNRRVPVRRLLPCATRAFVYQPRLEFVPCTSQTPVLRAACVFGRRLLGRRAPRRQISSAEISSAALPSPCTLALTAPS